MSKGPWRRENPPTNRVRNIDDLPVICTPVETGLYLGCTPEYVIRLAAAGVIQGFKVGNRWRFKRESILAYVERQAELTMAALR